MDGRDAEEAGCNRRGRERFRTERTSRLRSRTRTPPRRDSRSQTPDRLQRLESLVDRLMRRESESSDRTQTTFVRESIRSDCIPEFSPGKPNLPVTKWLDKIEQLAAMNRWDEHTKIYHMQNRLSGLARTWYNNLTAYTHTWDEWKNLLLRTFPVHHDFATTLKALVARVKDPKESMIQYYFGKLELLQACKITGKDAVSCLIDGLQDRTLRNGAIAGRYESPESLFTDYLSKITNDTAFMVDAKAHATSGNDKKWGFDRRRLGSKKRHQPYQAKAQSSMEIRCYNCKEKGHVCSKCPKPRRQCSKCKLLGHDESSCQQGSKRVQSDVRLIHSKNTNQCYFVDCEVNGKSARGYIDTGCSIVTVRKTDAEKMGIEWQDTNKYINGYAGGSTKALGKATVTLKVDLVETKVEVLLVDDVVQCVPVIIGQTFLNSANVTLVLRDDELRLFDKTMASLPSVDLLPPRKVTLWSQDAVVIPPHVVGFISVSSPDDYDGDVFIDGITCQRPGQEYQVPSCITLAKGGIVSIRNSSENEVRWPKGRLITRGRPCHLQDNTANEVSAYIVNACDRELFEVGDIAP